MISQNKTISLFLLLGLTGDLLVARSLEEGDQRRAKTVEELQEENNRLREENAELLGSQKRLHEHCTASQDKGSVPDSSQNSFPWHWTWKKFDPILPDNSFTAQIPEACCLSSWSRPDDVYGKGIHIFGAAATGTLLSLTLEIYKKKDQMMNRAVWKMSEYGQAAKTSLCTRSVIAGAALGVYTLGRYAYLTAQERNVEHEENSRKNEEIRKKEEEISELRRQFADHGSSPRSR